MSTPLRPALLSWITCFLLSGATLAPAQSALKIGVVDLEYLTVQSKKGKELQAKLQAFQQATQAEGERMGQVATELRSKITGGASALSDSRLAELQKQYEDQVIAIRRFTDDKEREGQKMQANGLRDVEKELGAVFDAFQAEAGYDLILNNTPGVVVMVGPRADITQQILDRMNASGR
ncbi:MAG: OmpH family outer membrane protein [Acidobacteriota bacterium]